MTWTPVVHLDPVFGEPRLALLKAGLDEISANVEYVLEELPRIRTSIGGPVADDAGKVFTDFRGCVYDVRSAIIDLWDELGLGVPGHPSDPGIANPDPRLGLGFIRDALHAEFEKLHALVQRLDAGKGDLGVGLAYMLVAESAANMLKAFLGIVTTLEELEARVPSQAIQSVGKGQP
ncbi:MAG: hypothetical protein ACREUW_04455 [Burkholderiales bacterium]